jgi:site-specific recombinase XerD
MRHALDVIAKIAAPHLAADTFPWQLLDYQHTAAIRARLAESYAPNTANKMLAALRGALKHALNLGLLGVEQHARASRVESIRGHTLPKGRALTSGEVRALFASCDPKKAGGARNVGMLAVLFGCGLRRSEAVGLDLSDLDNATGTLVVRGKGRKERAVYVANGAKLAVDAWLTHRGRSDGPLFVPVAQSGTITMRRMTDQAVLDLVRRLARRAQVATFSPHDLRRTFITTALENGADLATVAALAGHAGVSTTLRYDRRAEGARRKANEAVHVPFWG